VLSYEGTVMKIPPIRTCALLAALASLHLTVSVAGQAPMPPAPSPVAAAPLSPSMVAAEANRKRMRGGPSVRSQKKFNYPNAEKKAGNGGIVKVKGIVGADGIFSDLVIVSSNASPGLNAHALALARATIFYPAKDEARNPISVPVVMPFEFSTDTIRSDTVARVQPDHGDEERNAGLQGTVIVTGKIATDGRLAGPNVSISSRSEALDSAALRAAKASQYRVYKDGAGKAFEQPISLTYTFSNHGLSDSPSKISDYRCGQFVKDERWWRATWPDGPGSELFRAALGLRFGISIYDSKAIETYRDDFIERWEKAIEACDADPDARFVDTLQPEGGALARLLN
jgi:TonB family protein